MHRASKIKGCACKLLFYKSVPLSDEQPRSPAVTNVEMPPQSENYEIPQSDTMPLPSENRVHLFEMDIESSTWLLENFNSRDEIDAWMDENAAQTRPTKQQSRSKRQPFSTEEPLWPETPE